MNQKWIQEFREFVGLLNKHQVKYLLVGGYAVGWHGHPRVTKDIDFFVEPSAENAVRLLAVLDDFGLSCLGIEADDLLREESCIFFGLPPSRIELINFATGITFEEAWQSRVTAARDGEPLLVVGREILIKNKRAAGRLQDLADVEILERRPPPAR